MINNLSGPLDMNSLEKIQNVVEQRKLAAGSRELSADQQKELTDIKAAAKDFESVFLSMMLKEMRNTLDQENGGLFAGEGSDTLGGMFDMYMSQHLAKTQPLGIGDAVGQALDSYSRVDIS